MRDNGGWDNWKMIEFHKQICTDKRNAELIETQFMAQMNADMNVIKAYVSDADRLIRDHNHSKEYRIINREMIKIKGAEYNLKNKEIINAKKSIPFTCCCGSTFRTGENQDIF